MEPTQKIEQAVSAALASEECVEGIEILTVAACILLAKEVSLTPEDAAGDVLQVFRAVRRRFTVEKLI